MLQTAIRVCTASDSPAIVAVCNASWPESSITVAQLYAQDEDAQRLPGHMFQRYVFEHNGDIVAFAQYDQPLRFHRPHVFRINISVHPHYQGQGTGTVLYKRIMEDLQALQVLSI